MGCRRMCVESSFRKSETLIQDFAQIRYGIGCGEIRVQGCLTKWPWGINAGRNDRSERKSIIRAIVE